MRFLEIEGEVEKLLHAVFDAALKAGGMQLLGSVNQLIQSIQTKEAEKAE